MAAGSGEDEGIVVGISGGGGKVLGVAAVVAVFEVASDCGLIASGVGVFASSASAAGLG